MAYFSVSLLLGGFEPAQPFHLKTMLKSTWESNFPEGAGKCKNEMSIYIEGNDLTTDYWKRRWINTDFNWTSRPSTFTNAGPWPQKKTWWDLIFSNYTVFRRQFDYHQGGISRFFFGSWKNNFIPPKKIAKKRNPTDTFFCGWNALKTVDTAWGRMASGRWDLSQRNLGVMLQVYEDHCDGNCRYLGSL